MPLSRIKKGWEFDLIFRTGIRLNGELVRLLYVRNENNFIKAGFISGKRQGKAHIRNRVKRILREAFRQSEKKIIPGISLILSLKDRAINSKSYEIYADLIKLLKRNNLLI